MLKSTNIKKGVNMQEVVYFWNGSVFKLRKTVDGRFIHTVNNVVIEKENVPVHPLIFLETQAREAGWGRSFSELIEE